MAFTEVWVLGVFTTPVPVMQTAVKYCDFWSKCVKQRAVLFKPLYLCYMSARFTETQTHKHRRTAHHAHAPAQTLSLTHAHVCTRSRERKLQHNDKVWEHNGLSSAQTEARTSLALKGQQASPSFHSVPPVIIVLHYNDYSDGLYFANVEAARKYQWNMKMQARPERRGEKGYLYWRVNFSDVKIPMAWPSLGTDFRLLRDLRSETDLINICLYAHNRWFLTQ